MAVDVIYPVRPGDSNEELRYSLRSLAMNLPHGRVWIVGHRPSWVCGVEFIDGGNTAPHPRANLYRNLLLACTHPGVSDDVVIFNDDFFLIGKTESVPTYYRCSLEQQYTNLVRKAGPRGWWQESLKTTWDTLVAEGFDNPLSYELHVPFPCNRHRMADVLDRFGDVTAHNPPQWRTLYGVTQNIGGTPHADCKMMRPGPVQRPYHSTDDLSWRYFRGRFQQMFAKPCRYETTEWVPPHARSLVSVSPRNHTRSARRIGA